MSFSRFQSRQGFDTISRSRYVFITITTVFACLLLSFAFHGTAHAGSGGGVGSGGNSGGGGGFHQSSFGWGWAKYAISGPGPTDGFRNGAEWSDAVKTCQGASAKSLYMFVLYNSSASAQVYNYQNIYTGPPQFGGHFTTGVSLDHGRATALSTTTAKNSFDSLGSYGVSTTGYTFGTNVGWFCYDINNSPPPPQGWQLQGETTGPTDAALGSTIAIKSSIKNTGKTNAKDIDWQTRYCWAKNNACLGASYYYTHVTGTSDFPNDGAYKQKDLWNWKVSNPDPTKISQICVWIGYQNATGPSTAYVSASAHCVNILSGNLKGVTSLNSGSVVIAGQDAKWSHQLFNASSTADVSQVKAYIHRSVTDSSGNSVASESSTNELDPAEFNATMTPGEARPNSPKQTVFSATNGDVGDTICEWLVWTSGTPGSAGNGTTASGNYCVVVGKQPKMEIWGGDLRVGGDVSTSQSTVQGSYYGSWAEYGAFIGGLNQNSAFATGAALGGTNGSPTNNPSVLNELTFANKTADGNYGEFNNPSLVLPASQNSTYSAMANNLLRIPTATKPFSANMSGLSGAYTLSGNQTISASNIPADTTILLKVNGTVTINGDIKYPKSFGSIGSIPQVIIVANNINITDKVTQVDAWLLSAGYINTCSNKGTLTTSVCDTKLQLNGPMVSNTAEFRRTAGSDSATKAGDPAEVVNLRADSYLWEYNHATKQVIPTTVQVTQLPTRY